MNKIFWGFLLIFLDFNLNLNNLQIGLIPDFAGYLVMGNGLIELAEESSLFRRVKPFTTGMAVYTGILYVLNLVGISASLGTLSYLFGIISTAISLYISYSIVMGIMEMEENYRTLLNGESLKFTWRILAVFNVIACLTLLFPVLAVICIIIAFIAAICFLVAFSKSKNLYDAMKAGTANFEQEI